MIWPHCHQNLKKVVAWRQSRAKMCRTFHTICRPNWTSVIANFWEKVGLRNNCKASAVSASTNVSDPPSTTKKRFSVSAKLQIIARNCGEMILNVSWKYNYRLLLLTWKSCNFCITKVNLYKKFILCHTIAFHNLNHSHSTLSYTPSITTQSVHQLYSYSTCLQLHTIFLKHNPNPSL